MESYNGDVLRALHVLQENDPCAATTVHQGKSRELTSFSAVTTIHPCAAYQVEPSRTFQRNDVTCRLADITTMFINSLLRSHSIARDRLARLWRLQTTL